MTRVNKERIGVIVSSDLHYEELVVELYVDEKFIFLINQDAGPDSLVIETPPVAADENQVSRSIKLADFEAALKLGLSTVRSL